MAQPLTPEEFKKAFGIDIEEFRKKHPERFRNQPKVKPTEPMKDANTRGGKNLAAGVLALPSSVAGVADLVKYGTKSIARQSTGPMYTETFMDAFTGAGGDKPAQEVKQQTFMEDVLPPESMAKLEAIQVQAIDNYTKSNPKASPEDIAKFAEEYSDSDDFYKKTVEELPWGLRTAQQGQDWANKTVGLDTRADKMSAVDEALQIVGGAAVGLPSGAVKALTRPVVKVLGKKVAENVATKLAARALEAVTPMTLPLTPGNAALNAGIGVGVNEMIRGTMGRDTLIDYQQIIEPPYEPDKLPEPESLMTATGLAAGMFFGIPSITNVVKRNAVKQTQSAIKNIGQSAGDTLEEQAIKSGSQMKPNLSPITGIVDQNAPVKKAAQIFKSPSDTNTVPQLDATMSAISQVNRVEAENNALNYGILEGLGRNTVPHAELKRVYDQFDPATKDMFDKYMYAVQRQQDSTIYEKSLFKQMKDAYTDLQTQTAYGNKRSIKTAQDNLTAIQTRYNQLQSDDPTTRSSMVDWTRKNVDDYIKQGEAHPQIKQMGDMLRRISTDLVEAERRNGLIDAVEASDRISKRAMYMPLKERARPNDTGLKRQALLFGDKLKNSFKSSDPDAEMFINTAPRDVTGLGATVNNPKSAIIAIQEGIMTSVRNIAINNARREVIDTFDSLPNARGNLLKPHVFDNGAAGKSISVSPAQFTKHFPNGLPDSKYTKIFRNGKIELWEFSDPSIGRSLQFAPLASIPIMNGTRKFYQSMTTGLGAPWFAVKSFIWDTPLAQTTKNANRSLGLIDTYARRLVMGTPLERPVNEAMARLYDPTNLVSTMAAIPYQVGLRSARAVGEKIAVDLATHSGLFNAIAQSGPRGKAFVTGIGTHMTAAFDRSALAVMSRNMSTSLSHLNDVSKIADDYAKAAATKLGPLGQAFIAYKAVVESIQMSTRTAFFAVNYGTLLQKYNGKIPAHELKKLVQETRNLTGDMSRQSLSPAVQRTASAIPYLNPMIQGTRHILSSAVPQKVAQGVNAVGGNMLTDRNTRFWSQFTGGVVLPMIGSTAILNSWDGASEYWHRDTPYWKQMSTMPLPTVEAIEFYYEHGEWPPFDPKYLNEVPFAPEFGVILEPIKAGLRAMGVLGTPKNMPPQQFSQNIKDVMEQVTSFSTPPIIKSLFAMNGKRIDLHGMMSGNGIQDINNIRSGGANADKMTNNSDISNTAFEAISAIAGSAVNLVMETWNVADISYEDSGSFSEALSDALDTASFEVKKRLPAITVPVLFDARTQLYSNTPDAEYVYKTQDALEPIIGTGRQISVETDSEGRLARQEAMALDAAQKIKDPGLKQLSQFVYDQLKKKGAYKDAQEAATEVRADMQALEGSRYKIPDDKYNQKRNEMIKTLHGHIRIQSKTLQETEQALQKQIGRRFIQQYGVPFTYQALSDLVRKDVAR